MATCKISNGDNVKDNCGVCDNDLSNNCQQDCTGVWGGQAIFDDCGICGGNGCFEQNCEIYPRYNFDCAGNLSFNNGIILDKGAIASVYPNPFNPAIHIKYSLPYVSNISLIIYDLLGEQVEILQNGMQYPGNYVITWDGSNNSSGLYFIHIISDKHVQTQRIMLIK